MIEKKITIIFVVAGLVLLCLLSAYFVILYKENNSANNGDSGALDVFAQCLAKKEITMYGAEWCLHCKNEKAAFGSSFKYIPYVECPKNAKLCSDLGIDGFPTWIFPKTDEWPEGKKFIGEQGLKKLSEESGCVI